MKEAFRSKNKNAKTFFTETILQSRPAALAEYSESNSEYDGKNFPSVFLCPLYVVTYILIG